VKKERKNIPVGLPESRIRVIEQCIAEANEGEKQE
jgi:hypothetical protein